MALFLQPAILLCFAYFVVQTTASVGLQTFLPSALNAGLAVPLVLATSAVTAYLLGGAAGIVAGGFLAARTTRHDRVAAHGLARGAVLLALVGDGARCRAALIVPLFALVGVRAWAQPGRRATSSCATRRRRAPAGACTASSIRASTSARCSAPCGSGSCSTTGMAREMFYVVAALLVLAIGTVVQRAARDRGARIGRERMDLGIAGRARAGVRGEQGAGPRLRAKRWRAKAST